MLPGDLEFSGHEGHLRIEVALGDADCSLVVVGDGDLGIVDLRLGTRVAVPSPTTRPYAISPSGRVGDV